MVKSYLKFEHSKTFSQICSPTSNVVYDAHALSTSTTQTSAGRAVVGANDSILSWDIKKAELLDTWRIPDDPSPIRVWDAVTATVVITFNGHKSAVTVLQFDTAGGRLVSGSRDTDVIVWDMVGEVGLYRLRGHKDQVTSAHFLQSPEAGEEGETFVVSTGKDSLVKVWDLSSQHCVETHVVQTNGECWTSAVGPDGSALLTAGNDGEIKAWTVNAAAFQQSTTAKRVNILTEQGTFYRHGRDRTTGIHFHPKRDLLAFHGSEKSIEIFRIRSDAEVRKALARKKKRKREKAAAEEAAAQDEMALDNDQPDPETIPTITDFIVTYVTVRTSGKVRSMDWAGGKSGKSISMLISTSNNQLELFEVTLPPPDQKSKKAEQPEYSRTQAVDTPGHRTDIRCLALSSDDRMLASASNGSLKIWNTRTQSCLRTLECGYALCAAFLPGDKIVVIGTREGTLELFDIASSVLLDTVAAHEKELWSMQVSYDGKALVTASADKSAKFWDFKVVHEAVLGTERTTPKLTLVHTRTLKVADDILAVRLSPDSRLIAVSTLDNTIKVFFMDSLKLYLTLYGHKLPVLSISISYDSKLLVSSSADKNVRVWGLDFGDCHKTFFAHNDSILSVAFVPTNEDQNGHHFFSVSKDRSIKYYDADKFEQIQVLNGHHGEIWALAIATDGSFIATASHDKSIRVWSQTDEQIFLEEEREKELEDLYESQLLTNLESDERNAAQNEDGTPADAVLDPSKQTAQTLMAGEKITEALTLGMEDLEITSAHSALQSTNPNTQLAPPQRNPILTIAHNNVSASAYVLSVFEKIPAASLQDALLVLSFTQLPALFTFLGLWAEEGRNVPLICRVLVFMLKVHQRQIVSQGNLRADLEALKVKLRKLLEGRRKEAGWNLAGLRVLGRRVAEAEEDKGWIDDIDEEGAPESKKTTTTTKGVKRGFVSVA
ncbi:putative WD repeat-containing protein [Cyphellophora attinorum]|uniref:Putative WD repeat-containing protein n=1 Tax=Cyphellophora attinorum TaxID=1664694 RepID=A0A0N1HGX2_9EURO|nr:putative WD repeat-containing protein [Phialophora attinorum]KPI45004.1 putative WD repeat-containing protein [Phialophora attinorum]